MSQFLSTCLMRVFLEKPIALYLSTIIIENTVQLLRCNILVYSQNKAVILFNLSLLKSTLWELTCFLNQSANNYLILNIPPKSARRYMKITSIIKRFLILALVLIKRYNNLVHLRTTLAMSLLHFNKNKPYIKTQESLNLVKNQKVQKKVCGSKLKTREEIK